MSASVPAALRFTDQMPTLEVDCLSSADAISCKLACSDTGMTKEWRDFRLAFLPTRLVLSSLQLGTMPKMRGVSVYRDVSPGLETSRRPDRGSRGRTTLMFEDSFLDAEALDYALGFETNELVLARHPVHNTWWPVRANTLYARLIAVRPILGSRRFARRAWLVCSTVPSKPQKRSLCCLLRPEAPSLLLLTSRYFASNSDMEHSTVFCRVSYWIRAQRPQSTY